MGTFKFLLTKKKYRKEKTKSNALENQSSEELKVSIVFWMKRHKPEVLCCKVEKSVEDDGGKVLCKPPYCSDLQPIELYWSEGKGNVIRNYYFVCSVKYALSDLRYVWYGNNHHTPSGEMDLHVPEDKDPDFFIKTSH